MGPANAGPLLDYRESIPYNNTTHVIGERRAGERAGASSFRKDGEALVFRGDVVEDEKQGSNLTDQEYTPMEPGSNFAKIAVYGFSLIFGAIALGLAYGAIVTFEKDSTTNPLLMLVASLAFGGFGLGVFAMTRSGFRSQAREASLRADHPDQPWKWRDDWATGRVRSTGKGAAWFFWGFAILWNLISIPLLFFLPEEIIEQENYAALLGLLFPLVGIGLFIVAVRKTIQRRKYGDCLFLMDRVPGILGGDIRGTILLPRGVPAAETLSVRLSCIHTERRRSGKDTSTQEDSLWQTEQSVVGLSPTGEVGAQGAKVSIRVPFDASPTGEIDENNSVRWKLEAEAAVSGVDFATEFEIPVFKTLDSSPTITEERIRSEELSTGMHFVAPADHTRFAVTATAAGGTEFVIKPQGTLSGTLAGMSIVLIFVGIAILLGYAGAPIIFPLVFGLFALLIVFILIFSAFGESRIVVEGGHVSVRNYLFGIMTGKRMPCSSIAKIGVKGEGKTRKRGYYSINLTQADGKSASPLQFLPERQQAEWLAEEVRRAMEPWRARK